MPETRFPATAGQYHGELRVNDDAIEFMPLAAADGMQLVLGVQGWRFTWAEIAGLERGADRRGPAPDDPSGVVRVHYDGCARFKQVTIHGSLREFFAAADAVALDAAPGRRVA